MATDEWIPKYYDYNNSPRHILGLRTPDMKIAAYSFWNKAGFMDRSIVELESYNYDTTRGRLELDNQQADSGKAQMLANAKAQYLAYFVLLDSLNPDGSSNRQSPDWVGNFLHLG